MTTQSGKLATESTVSSIETMLASINTTLEDIQALMMKLHDAAETQQAYQHALVASLEQIAAKGDSAGWQEGWSADLEDSLN